MEKTTKKERIWLGSISRNVIGMLVIWQGFKVLRFYHKSDQFAVFVVDKEEGKVRKRARPEM